MADLVTNYNEIRSKIAFMRSRMEDMRAEAAQINNLAVGLPPQALAGLTMISLVDHLQAATNSYAGAANQLEFFLDRSSQMVDEMEALDENLKTTMSVITGIATIDSIY